MVTILTILIAITCVLLMAVILIQNPKGGGIDASLGGTAANQMFGAAKSTDFIEKVTWGLAATLFVLCILTAIVVNSNTGGSLITPIE
ncbi:MAG: preprotein translocase subunit SecG [Saprospiraceae bacterium]